MVLDSLLDPELLARWGYLVVALVALLEAIPFVGLAVPGQVVVILAGVLAHENLLDVRQVMLAAVVGGLIGQAIGYYAGRHVGRPILERFGPRFRITQVEVAKTEDLFRRHGAFAVFLGHFSFLTRGLVNLLAGISRYPARYFWPVTTVATLVWSIGYTALGFVFGAAWERSARIVGDATLALFILLLGGLALWYLARSLRRRPAQSKR